MLSNFRYQPFVANSGNLGRKVPVVDDVLSSHEQVIYPTTSLDENCRDFEFQTDRNYHLDLRQMYSALKLKFVKGCHYKIYNTTEVTKEHKEDARANEKTTSEEQKAPVPLATHTNNVLHSMFSNIEWYINNQQMFNSIGLHAHKTYIYNNLKGANFGYEGVLHSEGYDYGKSPEEIIDPPLSEHFFKRRLKMHSRPDGFMLLGKLGVDFSSSYGLLYPKMKIRLRLIRVRPKFYMISDNANVSRRIVDCSLYTRRIALKDAYHKKRINMLAYTPVELYSLDTLEKIFIISARQNQFNQENIFNNAPVRRIAIVMISNSAVTKSHTGNPL